ncbi:hypothetical protein KSS87_021584 [Heliosperma pusillum]|nr:hypothetical protein KSS87_021584 [Heliosperma pusillum]
MMRETTPLMRPISSFQKQNPIYSKLVVLFLLLGVTIFLFSSRSIDSSTPSLQIPTPFVSNSLENDLLISSQPKDLETHPSSELDSQESEIEPLTVDEGSPSISSSNELHKDEAKPKCNLFKGDWVPNPKGPAYSNFTCKIIESQQNCLTNGRPDTGYLYWRWKPRDCELPKFDPERFLNFMRNKSFAFIGDSINRNHVQSLLCILSQEALDQNSTIIVQVEEAKVIYQDERFKSMTVVFPSYNFTLARIWAPFLLKADTFEDNNGVSSADIKLDLDKLEENWSMQYKDFDYVIIGGGQWFLKTAIYHENDQVQGCHYCPGKNLTELGFDYAYRKAINRVLDFITSSNPKTQVLFRTITPSHFENGQWHNGGTCKRKVPFKGNEINVTETDRIFYEIEMQEFDKASSVASKKGITLKLFDSTQLSLLRPDGHPGPYRQYQPFATDQNAKILRLENRQLSENGNAKITFLSSNFCRNGPCMQPQKSMMIRTWRSIDHPRMNQETRDILFLPETKIENQWLFSTGKKSKNQHLTSNRMEKVNGKNPKFASSSNFNLRRRKKLNDNEVSDDDGADNSAGDGGGGGQQTPFSSLWKETFSIHIKALCIDSPLICRRAEVCGGLRIIVLYPIAITLPMEPKIHYSSALTYNNTGYNASLY